MAPPAAVGAAVSPPADVLLGGDCCDGGPRPGLVLTAVLPPPPGALDAGAISGVLLQLLDGCAAGRGRPALAPVAALHRPREGHGGAGPALLSTEREEEEESRPFRCLGRSAAAADGPAGVPLAGGGDRRRAAGDPRAACLLLADLLRVAECGAPALAERGGGAAGPASGAAATCESPMSGVAAPRRSVGGSARVRPPIATRVDAGLYSGHPRLHSVLTRGLKVRVPAAAPRVWVETPRSRLMTAAVRDFVAAGVLRPGRPQRCYRLFPVPKTDTTARLIYDLSSLTPFMPHRPCQLPSVERALELSAAGYTCGIKLDLRDGFYHIPLAESAGVNFGVDYDGQTYVFARLPMGLSIASSEMQYFSCATVKLVEAEFPGVKGIVYLDDFLFVARQPHELYGVSDYFTHAGININFEKSILSPVSRIIFLGIDVDLSRAAARVKPGILSSVRDAMMQCSPAWPVVWRQRLAGFVNFLRPCLKLPLETVNAILDGDVDACATVVPFMNDDVEWSFGDMCRWNDMHDMICYVDATPQQIGIICPGRDPVSVRLPIELPIYLAEYVAALTAVLSIDGPMTLFTDNMGVYYNLHKGRCPRPLLAMLCNVFRIRAFSVGFIPSHMNPADVPSRSIFN